MLRFISDNITWIINVLGAGLTVFLVCNGISLKAKSSHIEEALDRKIINTNINKSTMESYDKEEGVAITPDTIRLYEKKFNAPKSAYYSAAQFIPIFPLMGIMGTVAGLMGIITSQESTGVSTSEAMIGYMGTALSSTLYGLVWTISLKILVAIWHTRIIEDTEIVLDDYDKKINNAYMQKNIEEE